MKHRLAFALLGLFSPFLAAQAPVDAAAPSALLDKALVDRIKHEGLVNSHVMEHLDHLTNAIGHRLTGSRNFTLACEWAKGEFEKMGLQVELENWATWPIGWDRGQWQGRVVAPVEMDLQCACEAWTAPTKGRVRGPLLLAPIDAAELEQWRDKIPGAYLFETEGRFAGLAEFVAKHPIAGWVRASEGDAKYPNRIRVFGARRPRNVDDLPTTPEIVVRADQAAQLKKLAESGDAIVEFDMRNQWNLNPVPLHNVIAELRGSEFPDEVVVVSSHLDSWHQATGTTDNGTGSSTTIEAARILTAAGAKPKRTIRFCLWGGEEQGLMGSDAHVKRRRPSMPNVSAVFNHDTGTNWAQSLTVNEANKAAMERVVEPLYSLTPPDADWTGPVFELKTQARLSGGGGSDHASFIAAHVPAFNWTLKGRVDYFGYTWHSQWDTYNVAVPEYQRHTATVIALCALGVADLPEKLSKEGVEPRQGNGPMALDSVMAARFSAKFGGEGNLVVTEIKADGRAAQVGLQNGDRIAALNGTALKSLADLALATGELDAAKPAQLTVRRNDADVVLEVAGELLRTRRPAPAGADASLAPSMGERYGAKFGGDGELVLSEIKADGRAAQIGLQNGDRIAALNGTALASLAEFRRAAREVDPASTAQLTVRRNDADVVLQVSGELLLRTRRPR